ncbi:DUF488 domain-containing protein [Geomonas sp. RF6]|uniref:DUF488 domain-containing protein n=1 Tax=Geomonas sp. RF6 TaxID=2897342 RepID=UPI001E5983D1|nr:DUF488 domain-containing protein [Geomonas sp. RF6]UFS69513.1 DUF488 domain-containing protein [Geomonas sp. RF6]
MVKIKRVYDAPEEGDGRRVLVDRLWPRGLTKEKGAVDLWAKEIAPSDELRRWFGHDREKWREFKARYRGELEGQGDLVRELRGMARQGTVTLLYAARDEEHNNAVVLKEILER